MALVLSGQGAGRYRLIIICSIQYVQRIIFIPSLHLYNLKIVMQKFKIFIYKELKKALLIASHKNDSVKMEEKSAWFFVLTEPRWWDERSKVSNDINQRCLRIFQVPFIDDGQWFPVSTPSPVQPASPLPVFSTMARCFSLSLPAEQRDIVRCEIRWNSVCKASLLFSSCWYT